MRITSKPRQLVARTYSTGAWLMPVVYLPCDCSSYITCVSLPRHPKTCNSHGLERPGQAQPGKIEYESTKPNIFLTPPSRHISVRVENGFRPLCLGADILLISF